MAAQDGMDARGAIGPAARGMDQADVLDQRAIGHRPPALGPDAPGAAVLIDEPNFIGRPLRR